MLEELLTHEIAARLLGCWGGAPSYFLEGMQIIASCSGAYRGITNRAQTVVMTHLESVRISRDSSGNPRIGNPVGI